MSTRYKFVGIWLGPVGGVVGGFVGGLAGGIYGGMKGSEWAGKAAENNYNE